MGLPSSGGGTGSQLGSGGHLRLAGRDSTGRQRCWLLRVHGGVHRWGRDDSDGPVGGALQSGPAAIGLLTPRVERPEPPNEYLLQTP